MFGRVGEGHGVYLGGRVEVIKYMWTCWWGYRVLFGRVGAGHVFYLDVLAQGMDSIWTCWSRS